MDVSNNHIAVNRASVVSTKVTYLLVAGFLLASALPFALAWNSVRTLIPLVLTNDTFSQIPIIPLVSFFLIYSRRKTIFSDVSLGWGLGAVLMIPGIVVLSMARMNFWQLTATNQMSLFLFGAVLLSLGAFALFFGPRAFRAACFPLLFLVFTIPIPEPLLSQLILYLQKGSASAAAEFFRLAQVPYLRQGVEFVLPGVRIRVAEECSGIRSTLAISITTVLACHLFLRSAWRRMALCIVVVPIAIIKNGLRIATLSALAIYVNPGFLRGNLHHYGGMVFFAFALLPMIVLLLLLQKSELQALSQAKIREQDS
jgi:exosortase